MVNHISCDYRIPVWSGSLSERPLKVLVLCTGNSARSIIGEVLFNHHGAGRISAVSAGSRPRGRVHPLAVELLKERGLDTGGLRSKSWDEFAGAGAPEIDIVITVCDNAAGEVCPVWPGHPVTAHWGVPDPDQSGMPIEDQRQLFRETFRILEHCVLQLLAMPIEEMSGDELRTNLRKIGAAMLSETGVSGASQTV